MIIGINASRAKSGGAVTHMVSILNAASPAKTGISQIHVWSYSALLDSIPNVGWIVKHNPSELNRSLFHQLRWERFILPSELKKAGCTILLNVDAGTICRFRPSVTMSRDMLSYEPGEINRFGLSKARLRLIVLKYVQNASLKNSDGVIFLTRYAAKIIQQSCGNLVNISYIPHGVSAEFQSIELLNDWPNDGKRPIRILYISNTAPYKHQWHVVAGVAKLRQNGYNLHLELVGGGKGKAQLRLMKQIASSDPNGEFVTLHEFIPQHMLPGFLSKADLFVFASSCENMPNTLVEAMASGLPIACSNRGPMPEVLKNAGIYFDPENHDSIARAIETLINDSKQRKRLSFQAKKISRQYSWDRCASETFSFLVDTSKKILKGKKYDK